MSTLGNIVWLIFGGLIAALGYMIGGLLLCIICRGIPFEEVHQFRFADPRHVLAEVVEGQHAKVLFAFILLTWLADPFRLGESTRPPDLALILTVTCLAIPFAKQISNSSALRSSLCRTTIAQKPLRNAGDRPGLFLQPPSVWKPLQKTPLVSDSPQNSFTLSPSARLRMIRRAWELSKKPAVGSSTDSFNGSLPVASQLSYITTSFGPLRLFLLPKCPCRDIGRNYQMAVSET